MKRSGNRVIRETQPQIFTTEARRHGEESGDRKECIPAGQMSGHNSGRAVKDKSAWISAPTVLRNAGTILRSAFREIFDESAYDRFLINTNSIRSVASYRAFIRDRETAMARKPRCC